MSETVELEPSGAAPLIARWIPLLTSVLGSALLLGWLLPIPIWLPVGGLIAIALGVMCWRWPDTTVLLVIGLMYSNLPVVAVQFHGAPGILPAAVLALLGWPLLFRLVLQREPVQLSAAFLWVVMLTLVQFFGTILSRYPRISMESFVSFVAEGFLVYFAVINLIRTRRMLTTVFWVLLACAMLMGGAPMLQQLSGSAESEFGGLCQADSEFQAEETAAGVVKQRRFAGTIGEKNRYAQFMVLLFPIGLCLVSLAQGRARIGLAVAGTLLALLGFALAFSRGAAIGLGLAVVVAVGLKLLTRTQIKLVIASVIVVLICLPQYTTRLASISRLFEPGSRVNVGGSDGAIRGRLTEMGAAALAFRDHPLVGVGPGAFRMYSQDYGQRIGIRSLGAGRQAHSLPLDIAAEHGLLGLFAFYGGVFIACWHLLRARKLAIERGDDEGNQLATAMLLVMILYLTTSLFLHMSYIRYFWLIFGICEATSIIVAQGDTGRDYLWPRPPRLQDGQNRVAADG